MDEIFAFRKCGKPARFSGGIVVHVECAFIFKYPGIACAILITIIRASAGSEHDSLILCDIRIVAAGLPSI